jgi:CDI immunity proteins
MVAQHQSLLYLVPVALKELSSDPLTEGDFYPGDLLCAVLQVPNTFWQQQPAWREQAHTSIEQAIDHLDRLKDWERQAIEDALLDGLQKFASRKR